MEVGTRGKWTGDYHVVDLQQFIAHLHDGRVAGEQTIKEVYCQELSCALFRPFVFPAREAFDKQTRAIPEDLHVPVPHSEPQQQVPKGEVQHKEDTADGQPPSMSSHTTTDVQTDDNWVVQEICVIRKTCETA